MLRVGDAQSTFPQKTKTEWIRSWIERTSAVFHSPVSEVMGGQNVPLALIRNRMIISIVTKLCVQTHMAVMAAALLVEARYLRSAAAFRTRLRRYQQAVNPFPCTLRPRRALESPTAVGASPPAAAIATPHRQSLA